MNSATVQTTRPGGGKPLGRQRRSDGRGDNASFVLTVVAIVAVVLVSLASILTMIGLEVAADTVALALVMVVLVLGVIFFTTVRSRSG